MSPLWCSWDTADEASSVEAFLNELWSNIVPGSYYVFTSCDEIKASHNFFHIFSIVQHLHQFVVEDSVILHHADMSYALI